ncbi:hypothetical protein SLS58_010867 [Diplodia intermedia]|uniref:Dynactin arp1 p25 subunit n=1 Tax=Diplodia intermedia TaxID=856260 RepID=A0ABR3T2Z2_9PEZI
MLAKQYLPLLLSALAITAASALTSDPDWPLGLLLLKRQDDMSEAEYNCHDNCGQAIKAARASTGTGTSPCTDAAFLHDYAACLQCAGPANEDVWRYYGGSLAAVAASCSGLATVPATATQPAVSAAVSATVDAATATATASATAGSVGGASASSAGGSATAATATASATAAASSSASAAAAASSASAAGAASSARFGCVSMLGALSALGYFVLGF